MSWLFVLKSKVIDYIWRRTIAAPLVAVGMNNVPSLKRGHKDRQPENASPRSYGLLASRALAKDGFQAA